MPRITLARCNNRRAGGVAHGFGFGPTKRDARQAARNMADALAGIEGARKMAEMDCPEKCPRKAAEQVIIIRRDERFNAQIAPHIYLCLMSATYELVIRCE